jgi:CRISPR-associated endonuclease Cas3-HD
LKRGDGMNYAHTPGPTGEWHGLEEHSRAVAELAESYARPFGGGEMAHTAGLLHDVGKASPLFQEYLKAAAVAVAPAVAKVVARAVAPTALSAAVRHNKASSAKPVLPTCR